MKKLILLICLLASYNLNAQRFNGGVLLGFNASQVDGDTYAGYNKFGFAIGAYVYTPISKTIDIQLELKYMGKGASKKTTETDPYQYINQLDYIEIPIIFRVRTNTKLDIEGGLGYGYLFSNTLKDSYGSQTQNGLFKNSDFFSLVGLKYAATDKLFVIMRFSYSLVNIREGLGSMTNFRSGGAFNNLLSICLFYEINAKSK